VYFLRLMAVIVTFEYEKIPRIGLSVSVVKTSTNNLVHLRFFSHVANAVNESACVRTP
jgi:hypothetical protein